MKDEILSPDDLKVIAKTMYFNIVNATNRLRALETNVENIKQEVLHVAGDIDTMQSALDGITKVGKDRGVDIDSVVAEAKEIVDSAKGGGCGA